MSGANTALKVGFDTNTIGKYLSTRNVGRLSRVSKTVKQAATRDLQEKSLKGLRARVGELEEQRQELFEVIQNLTNKPVVSSLREFAGNDGSHWEIILATNPTSVTFSKNFTIGYFDGLLTVMRDDGTETWQMRLARPNRGDNLLDTEDMMDHTDKLLAWLPLNVISTP